ncbi:hypothetical protein V6X73_09405 [Spiribacter sp. 390]|uniref:DUF3310 domain-containing protein n=1 Tax=Spiribacter pallidus TaxID=1987936 RepID=A0ABV3TE59_9GAMM
MAELHTDDTFMWENRLMGCPEEDYDRVPREERGVVDPLVNRITHQRGPKVPPTTLAESMGLNNNPMKKQVSGSHYNKYPIQPAEYCYKNGLNNLQSEAISYITRYGDKGGKVDLEKAIHTLEILIHMEYGSE